MKYFLSFKHKHIQLYLESNLEFKQNFSNSKICFCFCYVKMTPFFTWRFFSHKEYLVNNSFLISNVNLPFLVQRHYSFSYQEVTKLMCIFSVTLLSPDIWFNFTEERELALSFNVVFPFDEGLRHGDRSILSDHLRAALGPGLILHSAMKKE